MMSQTSYIHLETGMDICTDSFYQLFIPCGNFSVVKDDEYVLWRALNSWTDLSINYPFLPSSLMLATAIYLHFAERLILRQLPTINYSLFIQPIILLRIYYIHFGVDSVLQCTANIYWSFLISSSTLSETRYVHRKADLIIKSNCRKNISSPMQSSISVRTILIFFI